MPDGVFRVAATGQAAMIKSELVQHISTSNPHLYQRDVENIVNAILNEIIAALARGDRVELRGFGAFSVKNRPARTGRNPRTGAHVSVAQKSVPFFKTGKEMRERLNKTGDVRPAAREPGAIVSRVRLAGARAIRLVTPEDESSMPCAKFVAIARPGAARHRHRDVRGGEPRDHHRLVRSVRFRASGLSLKMPLFMLIFVLVGSASWSAASRPGCGSTSGGCGRGAPRPRRAICAPGSTPAQPRRNVPAHGGVAAVRRAAGGVSMIGATMRIVTADDINRVLRYDALIDALAEAFRSDITAPDKIAHFDPAAVGQRGQGAADAGLEQFRRAVHRLQDRQRVSRQRQAQQAVGLRQLSADVGRHRRDAGGDGRHRADRLAHRLRLGARGALSRARGRLASRHGRRRRAQRRI